jgi:hypothetical protein
VAADAELELAAAVHPDSVGSAVLDARQEPLDCPEARRLDVEPARFDR